MRISIPDMGFGPFGGYRVLSRLATEWTRAGHEVQFLVHGASAVPYHPTEAEVVWLDRAGRRVATNAEAPVPGPIAPLRTAAVLRRGLRRHSRSADVVLTSSTLSTLAAASSGVRARKVFYSQVYEPEIHAARTDPSGRLLTALSRLVYRLPIVHVMNSPVYLSYPGVRATDWVAPGLDLGTYAPAEAPRAPGPFRMGCIGREEPWKGTRYVVDAFRALRDAGEDVELHVAFGGLSADEQREPGVRLVVPNGDAELGDFYRSLDVMVAPGTIQFGAPHYPVMEAMACGVPVVTTGYLPADETNAWIVPPHDAPAIAAAVLSVRQDPAASSARAERASAAVAAFGWASVADQMMRIFERETA